MLTTVFPEGYWTITFLVAKRAVAGLSGELSILHQYEQFPGTEGPDGLRYVGVLVKGKFICLPGALDKGEVVLFLAKKKDGLEVCEPGVPLTVVSVEKDKRRLHVALSNIPEDLKKAKLPPLERRS